MPTHTTFDPAPRAINQIKVMPLTVDVQKADEGTSGRRRLKLSGFASRPEVDSDNEIILPGFFDCHLPTFLENPVMLWQHERGQEQGTWTKVEPIDGEGYYVEGYMVDLGGEEDKRRFAMAEEGLIRSLSVGFNADYSPEYGYADEAGVWNWAQNGKLMEISPVTFPACPGARFEVAKSAGFALAERAAPQEDTEDARAERNMQKLAQALESLGNIVTHWAKDGGGPSAELVEYALRSISEACRVVKVGRVLSASNRSKVEAALSALQELLAVDDESRAEPKSEGGFRVLLPELPRVLLTTGVDHPNG